MRNKPHVPNAFNSLKTDLSPNCKAKKPTSKKTQNRDHTARAALLIAKANVNSLMLQQESEQLLNIRTRAVRSPTDVEYSKRNFVISSPRSTLRSKRQSVKFNLNQEEKENRAHLENVNHNLSQASELAKIAQDNTFNFKYKDYRQRIDEVNKAKTML